jgi:hypothetical protein
VTSSTTARSLSRHVRRDDAGGDAVGGHASRVARSEPVSNRAAIDAECDQPPGVVDLEVAEHAADRLRLTSGVDLLAALLDGRPLDVAGRRGGTGVAHPGDVVLRIQLGD